MSGINPAVWRALSELAFLETLEWDRISKPTRFRLDDEGCAWYLEPSREGLIAPWEACGQDEAMIEQAAAAFKKADRDRYDGFEV